MNWLEILLPQSPEAQWTLAIAAMTNVACALVGCYLVLQRMSLLGDAIAHAVLPGLVLAVLLSGELAIGAMLVGALATGLLTTFLTQTLHRHGGVTADASMGIVFTSLFALGVVLLRRYASGVHLDTDCIWQGQLNLVSFNTVDFLGHELPRAFLSILPVLVVNLAVILLLWKEFKIASFDGGLATTLGFRPNLLHYVLMALVAMTTVASFEAVGSILVVAMLIVPAAAAHLLCDRLSSMMAVAALIALVSAYLGFVAASAIDAEPAGTTAVAAGLCYFLSMLFSPRYGVIAKLVRNVRISLRIVSEDVLAMLFRLEELNVTRPLGASEATHAVGGGLMPRLALARLAYRRFITNDGSLHLTPAGRQRAAKLVRSHRLWEAYLVHQWGLPLDHVHAPAERMEHFISREMEQQLEADLGTLARDPHGRELPRE